MTFSTLPAGFPFYSLAENATVTDTPVPETEDPFAGDVISTTGLTSEGGLVAGESPVRGDALSAHAGLETTETNLLRSRIGMKSVGRGPGPRSGRPRAGRGPGNGIARGPVLSFLPASFAISAVRAGLEFHVSGGITGIEKNRDSPRSITHSLATSGMMRTALLT
ncbi:MAG: hypothetical protein HYU36_23410 [Planctomycetes bacterium]|nr:hypothetical protein [Planctomycetota bacterium]